MSVGEVERIAGEFLQVWSVGNLDVLARLASNELRVEYAHFPEPIEGREAFRRTLEETFRFFPDLVTTPRTIVADRENAAVEWQYEGTHQHGELFGVEPTGLRVRVAGMTFYRVVDGKVTEDVRNQA